MTEVVVERHGAVLVCRLNRPQERNGLTGALLAEYLAALDEARTDDAVRVVVTTGEGDAFSAGADMSDLDSDTARHGLNVLMHERLGLTAKLSTADRAFDRLGIGRETLAIKNFDNPCSRRSMVRRPAAASHWPCSMTSGSHPSAPRSRARSRGSGWWPRWVSAIRCRVLSGSRPQWT
jgi:hypothetical protein